MIQNIPNYPACTLWFQNTSNEKNGNNNLKNTLNKDRKQMTNWGKYLQLASLTNG